MHYKVDDICRDVRVALDLNNSSAQLRDVGDVDTLTLDEIITSKILEGVRLAHLQAPYYMLEQGHQLEDSVYWEDDDTCGWVQLPDDFLRLVVFEMSDWSRPVTVAISGESSEYSQQRSRHKGVRGTPQKPVCAIVVRPEGRVLEFYSCKNQEAYVRRGVYIPRPRISRGQSVDISEECYRGAISLIAGLVSLATGDTERYKLQTELAKTLLS